MAVGDVYHETGNSIAADGDFLVEGSASGTGAAEVGELGGTGDAELYKESDPDGDGTFEISVQIDSFAGTWHSQQNGLVVSDGERTRLRVRNVSADAQDFFATGMEIQDS